MPKITASSLGWLSDPSTGHRLFADPSEKSESIRKPPPGNEGFDDIGPKRTIVSRGTEIFVAKGREVRCADLQDLKARHPKSVSSENEPNLQYKVLNIPIIDFEVCQLEISQDGLLLAIIGVKDIVVCVLPGEGFAKRAGPGRDIEVNVPRYNRVGEDYHRTLNDEKIVRALWHPLGVEGASLVVLTSDAFVRTYDFTIDQENSFKIADQIFDLIALDGRERHTRGFTADVESMKPASCCFGAGVLGWRPFSLYILMRGGDIYALSPIVPSRWMATPEYLQSLSLDVTAELEGLDENATLAHKLVLRQQAKWINDIMNQEANMTAAFSASTLSPIRNAPTCLKRPEVVGPSPALQGPFLFQPAPLELSNEEYYACDIFHVESDPLAVIGILYSNGKIDICLEFDPLPAKWISKKTNRLRRNSEDTSDLPVIATCESLSLGIDLGPNSEYTSWPTFSSDPYSDQVWYVNHNLGVTSISMKGWLNKLSTVMVDEEEDGFLEKALEKGPRSVAETIVKSALTPNGSMQPVDGSLAIYGAYIGYMFIAASSFQVHSVEFEEPFGAIAEDDDAVAKDSAFAFKGRDSIRRGENFAPSSSVMGRQAHILDPPFTVPPIFTQPSALSDLLRNELQKNKKVVHNKVMFSTESQAVLKRARDTLKNEYDEIMKVAREMYLRAEAQRLEYRRQLAKIHEIEARLEKLKSKDVKERLVIYLKKQEELQSRADEALKTLIVKNEMGLSDAEKKWFKEAGKLKEKIQGNGRTSLMRRKAEVQKLLQELTPAVDGEGTEGGEKDDGVPEEVRQGRVKQLNELLDKDRGALVKSTRQKLERLSMDI
ncbi:hypothetical protein RUND412_004690 [Rhizina undulata]